MAFQAVVEHHVEAHRILNLVKLTSWVDLALLADKLLGWVYRGHRSANWRLTSKLERNAPGGITKKGSLGVRSPGDGLE